MIPLIDKKQTGINLRRIMDECGFTVKDVQQYLRLGSIQSVYHWLNGISMPSVDNLYALSYLFQVSVDDMLCGSRKRILTAENQVQLKRMRIYYGKIKAIEAAQNYTISTMTKEKYFHLNYEKDGKTLKLAEENTSAVEKELSLAGYFAIVSSDNMTAREAIELYKSRDAT